MVPTSTLIDLKFATKLPAADAVAALAVVKSTEPMDAGLLAEADRAAASRLLAAGVASGKSGEVMFDLVGEGKPLRRVLVAGLGEAKSVSAESFRVAGGALLRAVRKHAISRIAIIVPSDAVEAVVTGVMLAAFRFDEYKGSATQAQDAKSGETKITPTITIVSAAAGKAAFDRAIAIGTGQNFARTIASRPGNDINPPELARVTLAMAKEVGLKCRVLDEKEMARLGMGGILAVGAGSKLVPPRIIVLEWPGSAKKQQRPIMAVGKAITFDTGGISIKPADRMGRMVYDKCGGMAVLGFMYAIAKLKIPRRVVSLLAVAENHISDTAYRPGDLLKMYNGVTVEVISTDAEGRLVLGDALSWGIETYKPSAVVDLATLTGAIVVALGKSMAGAFGNSDPLFDDLRKAAASAGEKIWRMPLDEIHRKQIKAEHADIMNSGGREAGASTAAAFISYFIPEGTSWMHLDIAGCATTEKDLPYYGWGALGWGVRTLINWAEG